MRYSGISAVAFSAISLGLASPAAAQEWTYNVSPYLWASGLSGDLGTLPGVPSQDVDLSFKDVLENLDFAAFLVAAARNGDWVYRFDGMIVQSSDNQSVNAPNVDSFKLTSRSSSVALTVGHVVSRSDTHLVDVYAGGRAWWVETDFKIKGSGQTVNEDSSESWIDPLIGVDSTFQLSDKWSLFGAAEIGGFQVGSDLTWGLLGGARYAVSDTIGITFGYRYMYVDYEKGGFVYETTQKGPVIGASFKF